VPGRLIALILLAFAAGCLGRYQQTKPVPAEDLTLIPPFPAPEPNPTRLDEIELVSKEILRGRIKYLRDYQLEIDSKEMKDNTFKWRKVRRLTSSKSMRVLRSDQVVAEGPVEVRGETVVVGQGDTYFVFPRHQLVTIVPGTDTEWSKWHGYFDFGLSVRSGNTNQTDFTLALGLVRRAATSRAKIDYVSSFSSVNSEETVNNQRMTGSYDIFTSARWYVTPFALELYRDVFQNIDLRSTPMIGGGYHILRKSLDRKSMDIDLTVAGGYRYTQFNSGQDPAGVVNLSLIFHWDWAVTPKLDFTIDYDIQIGVTDIQDTNQNFKLQFSWDVMNDFDIDLTLYWYWIGSPQPDSAGVTPENLDLRMVFSIKWEW